MNPAWLTAGVTCIGLLINTVWTIVNLQMRQDLTKQLDELKLWMSANYVSEQVCGLRMGATGPRGPRGDRGDRGEHGIDA